MGEALDFTLGGEIGAACKASLSAGFWGPADAQEGEAPAFVFCSMLSETQ